MATDRYAIAAVSVCVLLVVSTWAHGFQPATTVDLGLIERDLTGDGRTEILRVIGVGPTIDDLDAEFTIESAGVTIYRFKLQRLSRTLGFDAGRRVISAEERRQRLDEFRRPPEFIDSLRAEAPRHLAEIPDVIVRGRQASDTRNGSEIWEEILKSPVTIFTFSPGGDEIVAIGWSARAGRFYRLVECC